MVVDLDMAFSALQNPQYWMDVAMVFAGFMGAIVARAVVENRANQNLPDEAYGIGLAAVGLGMGRYEFALGAAAHAVNNLAGTLGVRDAVLSVAGGS